MNIRGGGIFSGVVVGAFVALPVWAQWFSFGEATSAASPTSAAKQAPAGAVGGQEFKVARVRWLDKQTNRVQDLTLAVGTPQTTAGMKLALVRCVGDYANVPLQDVAWLEVRESGRDSPWFAGWMFNTYPEVATLDHPRFDLQLIGCGDQPRRKPLVSGKTGVGVVSSSDGDSGGDSEAPVGVDTETPLGGGNDPYYVPGVEKTSPTSGVSATIPAPEREVPFVQNGGQQPSAADSKTVIGEPAQQPAAEVPFAETPAAAAPSASDQESLRRMMDQQ